MGAHVRLAFDSRTAAEEQGAGCYARDLLRALRDTAGEHDEIVETHRPRGAELFHAPWMQGAMLHSPCPMVVTLHDLATLRRPSERLRAGGIHLRMRHLALQRASHVIVPSETVAREAVAELGLDRERVAVIAEPSASAARTWEDVARETWAVYRQALTKPHRPCVTSPKRRVNRRRAASAPPGWSSAEL
jgi:hypothetical protein